ncbi:Glycogen phosphorylase [Aquisphaera giovannonii]|uniref:Alpha-1,4 glucan phosphorylase n=1 Tax=Aquisphaera giovannonii TaxID=406548 RepID=A0A5B9WB61_9BACT|nr:glycogen/starch/alpha-glucan phosphorylase [Aquisphaera giovannonii]QEH37251.1 Glycogen phosphorylase [Aquisphaera giovannonii]
MPDPKAKDELEQYEGTFRFRDGDYYDRHLVFDHVVPMDEANQRQRFEAVARSLRDLLTQRWLLTKETHHRLNAKQVYYLSMEYLIGRTLLNTVTNLGVRDYVRDDLRSDARQNWAEILDAEPDAGLGNGGLGRLAACFLDSMATLEIPAIGYGLRYEYGVFRQEIHVGNQVEQPDNWLLHPDPWEVSRTTESVEVSLNCSFEFHGGALHRIPGQPIHLLGIPYDRPVAGYGGRTINTLRLWGAASPDFFDFGEFSGGEFVDAVLYKVMAESLTRVLYPDDSTTRGRTLRFLQEYFLVACSLADILRRFRDRGNAWSALPEKVAIQLNDTHPAMAVAELMRILLDEARLGWDEAWDLTVRTLAYTNHTLLPEALEKWPVEMFQTFLPRLLEIIYEINYRFLGDVHARYPGDNWLLSRVSLIEELPSRQVRMANLAIVGTHSTNGVSEIHSRLLRESTVVDLADLFPSRFNNKTNGVTPRRWLLLANPDLAALLTEALGDAWPMDLDRLEGLAPLADDAAFRERFRAARLAAKRRFVDWIGREHGIELDSDALIDSQVKRIHEYKRQLLNILRVLAIYHRLRTDSSFDPEPRTYVFAGKAAPAYHLAKTIIRLINDVAAAVERDPLTRGRIRVVFLPNYGVTLAERLIPATDISEQISTAGYEASGTSNMKFMMNGALTIGTRDGATIEMGRRVGEENMFFFGLTAEQVASSRASYSPLWHYDREPETRAAIDLLSSDLISPGDPARYESIRHVLLEHGDYYMHLADLGSYLETQERLGKLWTDDPEGWTRKSINNVAASGYFSSDRTIKAYASEIWGVEPCPIR